MKRLKRIGKVIAVILFWLIIWWVASEIVDQPLLFPSPLSVGNALINLMGTKTFYFVTAKSLWNVLIGIAGAVILGVLLAFATHTIPFLRTLTLPLMATVKATPVASFIVLALIWIGSAKVPTFIMLLIVLPVVWTNLDEGFSAVDPSLDEVTKVFRMSSCKRFRALIFPTLHPYFTAAVRTSVGFAWKAGIAAEIIAMPKDSIGTMIGDAKQYIQTADMFAWTLTVVILSLILERLFGRLIGSQNEKKGEDRT